MNMAQTTAVNRWALWTMVVALFVSVAAIIFGAGMQSGELRDLNARVRRMERQTAGVPANLAAIRETLIYQAHEIHHINHILERRKP